MNYRPPLTTAPVRSGPTQTGCRVTAATSRTLPIRLPPIPGESLDSWIAAYAARLDTPIMDLTSRLGPAKFWRQPAADIAVGKGAGHLAGLATTARLTEAQVEAMWRPLARYRIHVSARFPSGSLKRMVLLMRWSRFCPACLTDTDGRWQARWRLAWQLACPNHGTLLRATCHCCDGRQRQKALLQDVDTVQTVTCDVPTAAAAGRGDHRCARDLREAPLEPDAPTGLLHLQERLAPLLKLDTADTLLEELVDLLADVVTIAAHRDLKPGAFTLATLGDTAHLAAALDRAHHTLTAADPKSFLELALADVQDRPHPLPRSWQAASAPLASRVVTSRDAHMRPIDRIRWRSTTTGTRPTVTGDDARQRFVPTALWADWVVRLQPPDYNPITFSKVAAAALLLPGATRSFAEILTNWTADKTLSRTASTVLQKLAATEHGHAIFRALTQLSDRLLAYGSPINSQRRQQLTQHATLIDATSWDRICAQAGVKTGGPRKLRLARLWIWETVTGGLLEHAPHDLRPNERQDLTSYHHFPLAIGPRAATLLDNHARDLLDSLGCQDEPTTWSPPISWVDVTALPGRDPASIAPDQIETLLRQRLAPSDIAERLGITLDHVRLVIRQHPPHLRLRSTGRRPTARNQFPSQLTPQRLQELVVDEQRSLRSIRTETGASKHALRNALLRDGIPVPPSGRPHYIKVDARWLRTQYMDRRRTLPDIAAEVGTSPANLARIAQRLGIPIRARGGASHAAAISAPSDWPQPLASAILGQGGRQRVERFQVYARARSLNQIAPRLSTAPVVLLSQLGKLEQACGGTLIERSNRQQKAQQLTALGKRLLLQANKHLGPNPDAPPPLPEPLSSALNSFWAPTASGGSRSRRTPPVSLKPLTPLEPMSTPSTAVSRASKQPAQAGSWTGTALARRIGPQPLGVGS